MRFQWQLLMAFSFGLSVVGRNIALKLAKAGKEWKAAAAVRMPEARGDIREIIGQPVFVPLQKLATIYGKAGLYAATSHACTCRIHLQSHILLQPHVISVRCILCLSNANEN